MPGRRVELELTPDHPVEYDAWDLEGWARRRSRSLRGPATVEVARTRSAARSRAGHPGRWPVDVRGDLPADRRIEPARPRGGRGLATTRSTCSRWPSRSTSTPSRPRATSSSDTSGARRTPARRGTRPSSRSARTASSTCPSRRSGSPSSTTAATATRVQGDAVRVSLLRAANYPDPNADHGRHEVTLALLPHGPGLHDVLEEAEALNRPLRVVDRRSAPGVRRRRSSPSMAAGVDVVAVKGADDGSGDLVRAAARGRRRSGDRQAGRGRADQRCGGGLDPRGVGRPPFASTAGG